MKKILYVILTLIIAFSVILLVSCEKEEGTSKKDSQNKNDTASLNVISDLSEFSIVRSDKASDEEKAVAVYLRKSLNDKFETDMKLGTDYSGAKKKEILIGNTNRNETKKAMEDITSYSEYLIRRVGDKIIICAGSTEALEAAVKLWTTKMVNKSGKLCIPGDEKGYIYSPETKLIDKLTIEGTSISNFVIVNTSPIFEDVANKLGNVIFRITDVKLQIFTNPNASLPKDTHVIRICDSGDYKKSSSFSVVDGNIEIIPSYYDAEWGLNYVESLLNDVKNRVLDITSSHNTQSKYEIGEIYSKEDVMTVLEKVYNSDEIIVGTEINNGANNVSKMLTEYYEKSGQYPGIIGLDVRLSNLHKLGEEGCAKVIADLTRFAEGGGLVTASAHFSNPAENGGDPTVESYRGILGGDDAWAQLVTEGTNYNTSLKKELSEIADFFEELKNNGVPIIWRPLHEANANWFWFCMVQGKTKISEESFSNLWKYIYNYFTLERGLDNLLWEFSPNNGNESSTMVAPLYGFPGKDYVDLVGFDWYTSTADIYAALEDITTYRDLTSLGMIVSLTEFGPSGNLQADEEGEKQEDLFSCESILTIFDEMKRSGKNYKFAYLLTWTANISIPSLGKSAEFMADPRTLGQAEVKALFEDLK